jgi:hypothetical protein
MRTFTAVAIVTLCAALMGCANTKVESTGTSMEAPLCRAGGEHLSVVSFWQPQWRPDQKEPALREAAAIRGMEDFFAATGCIDQFDIRRLSGPDAQARPSNVDLVQWALNVKPNVDRVVFITVHELGPKLLVGLPVLVEGGTEVVLDIRALDARTSRPLADLNTHWQNGGTFVIKGVKTLPSDMKSALKAALMPERPRE